MSPKPTPTTCHCGHALYTHGRRKVPNAGVWEYVGCRVRDCPCVTYRASDGSKWPHGIGP